VRIEAQSLFFAAGGEPTNDNETSSNENAAIVEVNPWQKESLNLKVGDQIMPS